MKDWFCGNMGTPGEYAFKDIYFYTVAVIIIFLIALNILALNKRISKKTKRTILVSIASFQLFFEVFWRFIYIFVKHDDLIWIYPMYPCNLAGILVPIIALLNNKTGKRMFYLFAFIGACMTFVFPQGIFNSNVLTFPILKSVLQHTGILLIPSFEYSEGTYRPSIKDYPLIVLGCLVHVVNCEVITRFIGLNGDYMYFRSTLPFVIPKVPQFITLSVFSAIVLALLSFFLDYKASVHEIRAAKERKKLINKKQ